MNKENLEELRKQIEACIQKIQEDLGSPEMANEDYSRKVGLVLTNLEQAKMWFSGCLEAISNLE